MSWGSRWWRRSGPTIALYGDDTPVGFAGEEIDRLIVLKDLQGKRSMIRNRVILFVAAGFTVAGCATTSHPASNASSALDDASTLSSSNPFVAPSTLPFQAPPFDRIKDSDYQPALEAGMRDQIEEIEAVANQSTPATFDNTIIPMERSGGLLTRVSKAFNAVTGANTDSTLQRIQEQEAPKLAAHSDAIFLNGKLFQRVKSIYDSRETLGFNAEQKFLVELYYKNFIRAGAQLSEADKTQLR